MTSQEVARQMKMNKERDEEMDVLYREEARRVWQKREHEWSRERSARKKLMDQVFYSDNKIVLCC